MKPIMNLAMKMAAKKKSGGGCMNEGGKCMSHGGVMDDDMDTCSGAMGSYQEDMDKEEIPEWEGFEKSDGMEPQMLNQGGGVDEANADAFESSGDPDGDDDDLVYSPEVPEADSYDMRTGASEDDNKSKFLKSFMISRRLRGMS